ncbi:MAG: 50S ribosomal protein L15 [SAR202 cluster bacterium]|nr:50S ribosomal protein L15 [SAR202 cluster bacterium]
MMEHLVRPKKGARRKSKRVGRGDGSGRGSYSGRGMKGQKSRSGKPMRPGFEGGQLPLIKRLPERRGFTNIFRIEYSVVNVGDLESYSGQGPVTLESLVQIGLVRNTKHPLKVLGNGSLTKALTVTAHKFSASAKQKIEGAGGKAELLQT